MNHNRRLCLMMLCLGLFFAGVPAANWLINPYRAWRPAVIDTIYLGLAKGGERVMTPYRVRNEQPTTLLVGSSRVLYGMPIEQGYRDGVLNAALPGATIDEIAAVLRLALDNPKLKRVIWGVDFYAFDENYAGFRDPETHARLDREIPILTKETLLSLDALEDSYTLVLKAIAGRGRIPPSSRLPIPWPEPVIREALEQTAPSDADSSGQAVRAAHAAQWVYTYAHHRHSPGQLALFEDTVAHITKAGVELVLFIPPMSEYELETVRQTGQWETFQQWKREVAGVSPYWDFSGYHELSHQDHFFGDFVHASHFCHFRPGVGEVILRRLLSRDCAACGSTAQSILEAGVWVDPATLEEHLARQEAARIAQLEQDSPYAKLVEEVIDPKRVASRSAATSAPTAARAGE